MRVEKIIAAHPDADRDNVRHTLILLEQPPLERLRRSLIRGRATAIRPKDKLTIPVLRATLTPPQAVNPCVNGKRRSARLGLAREGEGGLAFQRMSKQSAVIDKSLFHELCMYPDVKERERLWHELHLKYQLVVPLMLIEETLVNAVAPGKKSLDEVERLIEQVVLHRTCWLDDIHEIVFRDLVRRTP